jgi:glycosyltransferase involved in cell wall biosynthesis
MNIAIISTFDIIGGAAIAANRLFKGLKQLKQKPVMLVRDKNSNGPDIYKIRTIAPEYNIERMIFQHIHKKEIVKNRTARSNTWFSIPYPGYDLSETPIIAKSDIINLHWVAEFQSVETIANLLKTGKPVVWTLHDENTYTGGCHYTAGCAKYQTDCRDCLQLKSNQSQVPYYNLKNKTNLWNENLTIVTPSKWLAECAKKSCVFKGLRVEVIPNSLETDIFKPKAKNLAKKEIGLEPQSIILLFGAHSSKEKRKGFNQLLKAIKCCFQDDRFKNLAKSGGIRILNFGPPQGELEELDIEIESIGYVNDNDKLSTIYSAADIFILPSLEDNLPNTMLEAMACGTPVVSFEVGGMPDVIQNGVTGYMAPCFNSEELGALILNLTFNEKKRKQMGKNCRKLIKTKFKLTDQAENYLELFEDLLKKGKTISKEENSTNSTDITPESGEIILNEWTSSVQPDFFNIYRRVVLALIDTKEQQILKQGSQLKEKNEQLLKINQQLAHKARQKSQKDRLLLLKDQQLSQKDQLLHQMNQKLLFLQEQLREKETKIQKIYKSYSYRISQLILFPLKLLRKITGKVKKKFNKMRNAAINSFTVKKGKYEKKINLSDQLNVNFGSHRSGWVYAIRNLKALHNPNGVLLDSFIERTFCWHPEGVKPHLQPWIGFIHVPPQIPEWFSYKQANEIIFNSGAWGKSLPYCRGLFTLSDYHRKHLEKKLDIPVNNLFFPMEIPKLKWNWDRFTANKEKKIVQVGWWLRKLHAVYQLPLSGTQYKKIFLSVEHKNLQKLMRKEREILLKEGTFNDEMYETAKTVAYLSNNAYDKFLSENIVFICLYDASANNTIIECIARNTPILINPIEAVKEYLGENYPLYYHSLEEAAEKSVNFDLIYKTHQYLINHPIKHKFTGKYFLKSFANSQIYRSLKVNPFK